MNKFVDFLKGNKKVIIIAISAILVIVLICLFALKFDSWVLKRYNTLNNDQIYDDMRTIILNDKEYLPKNMSTYLVMGIDKNTKIENQTNTTEQADFILFIVCDHTKKTINALQINRDSLTQVKMLSQINGSLIGVGEWQITLAHTYGLDESSRALNTIDAFKSLMKNVPVSMYLSFSMPIVSISVDAIGGFDVTITEEAANPNIEYETGKTIPINKDNALEFVRNREDNIGRMARQRLFMEQIFSKYKNSNIDFEDYLDDIKDYSFSNLSEAEVTNIDNYLSNYTFEGIKTLTGTSGTMKVANDEFATFKVDDSSINDFLINYCYDLRK